MRVSGFGSIAGVPITILSLCMLIVFPQLCTSGIIKGLNCCLEMLIPSLFPYMVLTSFIMRTNVYELVGRMTGKGVDRFLHLPECCSAPLMLSFIGGYPVGARCVAELYDRKQINGSQAERMMLFCVCPGPAFLITAIGSMQLGNITSGVILYISQLVSGFLLCFMTGLKRNNTPAPFAPEAPKKKIMSLSDAFITSVSDGSSAALSMCALVLVFSMMIEVISGTGSFYLISRILEALSAPYWLSNAFLPAIMEISLGSRMLSESCAPLWVLAFAAGFGGICVHFQIFAMLSDVPFSKLRFMLFRLINAVLSAVICQGICLLFPQSLPAMAFPGGYSFEAMSINITGSIVLVVLSTIFLLSLRSNRVL